MQEILNKNNFEFKKKFGQNFISDTNLLKSIVKEGNISKNDQVLEIGPGAGSLTLQLCEVAQKVVSYEIDTTLKPILQETLKQYKNSTIIYEDIMSKDIKEIESNFDKDYVLVANLPYYITTPILFKFINNATKLKSIYVMVQKEVGERICAKCGSTDYGVLSVIVSSVANAKIVKVINRNMFYPVPNVDSCMIKIDMDYKKLNIKNIKHYGEFIQKCFAMRRKTLANNLEKAFNISRKDSYKIFKTLNIPEDVRAEKLDITQFFKIYSILFN